MLADREEALVLRDEVVEVRHDVWCHAGRLVLILMSASEVEVVS